MSSSLKVAVIGGGWAGCAAAVELIRRGHHVTLYEAARTLGGRARRVELDGRAVDNGQHILLGAYTASLSMMRTVGVDPDKALLRLPLQMRYPDGSGGMSLSALPLPAPFHMLGGLLRAQGLDGSDKMALARFFTTARWMGWQLNADCSVSELLVRYEQTERTVQLLWQPLCIAALNTPPERASARVFLRVLGDSLGARRAHSDMLIPRSDLGALFPEKAAEFLLRHGGEVACGTAVKQILSRDGHWHLMLGNADEPVTFDAVVVATQPSQADSLAGEFIETGILSSLRHEPITTCYLQYAPQLSLPHPLFALVENPDEQAWGQFVFDRGWLSPEHKGLLAVVVSASTEAIESGHADLADKIAAQLHKAFNRPELLAPAWTKIISEKRATFSCAPNLRRPSNRTTMAGLVLAGDYTASDYPATIESAVRSGIAAARALTT